MRLPDESEGGVGSFAAKKAVLLAFEPMIVHEEVLEFFDPLPGEIVELAYFGILMVGFGDGDQAVVPNFIFSVELFSLNHSDETGSHCATGVSGFVHQQQDIDGIAVGRNGARQEAEVIGEDHARGQDFFECEDTLIGIIGEFIAAVSRRFDDDL